MTNSQKVIAVKDLKLDFIVDKKRINVIDGVSFELDKGETLGIVGESGCGKSITALAIMQLLPKNALISGGEILFNGENLLTYSKDKMIETRGSDIAMIFQEPMTSLNPVYKVGDQIAEMVLLHSNIRKEQGWDIAKKMLELVAIPTPEKMLHQYPHQLSGGMRQRVMIAMAMACNPKILIADEPTTALDVTIQAQILDLMRDLKDKVNSGIILITHDLGVVAEMCQNVVVMYAGRIVEKADVFSLFDYPLHPYTIGLLDSLPKLNENMKRLSVIPGAVPIPQEFAIGCRFSSRCSKAKAECFTKAPPLKKFSDSHYVACWMTE